MYVIISGCNLPFLVLFNVLALPATGQYTYTCLLTKSNIMQIGRESHLNFSSCIFLLVEREQRWSCGRLFNARSHFSFLGLPWETVIWKITSCNYTQFIWTQLLHQKTNKVSTESNVDHSTLAEKHIACSNIIMANNSSYILNIAF